MLVKRIKYHHEFDLKHYNLKSKMEAPTNKVT